MDERKMIYLDDAKQAILDLPNAYNGFSDSYDKSCIIDVLEGLPPAQPEREILDELMDIMKEYYFTHRYEYDEAWENGFAKCMNLIPNVYMKRGKDDDNGTD